MICPADGQPCTGDGSQRCRDECARNAAIRREVRPQVGELFGVAGRDQVPDPDCTHECHRPYDEWKALQQLPPFSDEVVSEIHTHTVNHGRQMDEFLHVTRPKVEPAQEVRQAAVLMFEYFTALTDAGFTERQALKIISYSMSEDDGAND